MKKERPKFQHIPVLLNEAIIFLNCQKNKIYVDATLGSGGHCQKIAEMVGPKGKVIGIDRDIEAIKAAKKNLKLLKNRIVFVNDNFENFDNILNNLKIDKVDGILFDLGVSSYQLENIKRGFSFSEEQENLNSKLDMRMDQNQELTAYDVINKYQEDRLRDILFKFGEEPYSRQIARKIVQRRVKNPIITINDLLMVIKFAIPPKYRFSRKYGHYASKVFRGIRMEVNQELNALNKVIGQAINRLKKNGRLVIISFHSLEDRIVKHSFRAMSKEEDTKIRILFKKPIRPSDNEIKINPRARSAKLRAVEKIK